MDMTNIDQNATREQVLKQLAGGRPIAQTKKTEGEEASKAFTTGHEINPERMEDGAALRYEFLDDEITMLTWSEQDLNFYKSIPRVASPSPVAEYAVYTRHGEVGPSRFVSEIGVSSVSDPSIRRKSVPMKFISDTKQLSLAASISNTITDTTRLLTDDGIANVAKTIEWAAFYGDSDLTASHEPNAGLQFDGLLKLVDPNNIINARGKALSQEMLNYAAVTIGKGYANATDAFMPIGVQAEFINKYLAQQTHLTRDNSDDVNLGFRVNGFHSARGFIKLHGSTVMELDNILDEHKNVQPGAPQPAVVTPQVVTGADGDFRDEDLGDLNYKVVVHSEESDSAPTKVETATVANKTDSVELTIQTNGMYQQAPQFVSVYRQHDGTGLFYLIGRVAVKEQNANGELKFTDTNAVIPGTADVFIGELSRQVVHLFEFLPMVKMELPSTNATHVFTILWYGALALRKPKAWAVIRNVDYTTVNDPHATF